MNWIQHPLTLSDEKVKLVPLADAYFSSLINAANNERIWEHMAIKGHEQGEMHTALKSALLKRMNGEEYPFVVIDNVTDKVIGSTRYMDMYLQFRKLEIGWTWYSPSYWGTGINTRCKLLLLTHAFETLNCVRVQLTARDVNRRSRAAIEKIGATFEGVLRNHLIRFDTVRSTAMYSVTNEEWPVVKKGLQQKIKDHAKI